MDTDRYAEFFNILDSDITQAAGRWLLISKPRVWVKFVNGRSGTAERLSDSSIYTFPLITIRPRSLHTLISPTAEAWDSLKTVSQYIMGL